MKAEVPVSVLEDKALCREIKRRFPLTTPAVSYSGTWILVAETGDVGVGIRRFGGIRQLWTYAGKDGVLVGSFAGPGWKERLFGALKTVLE